MANRTYNATDRDIVRGVLTLFEDPNVIIRRGKISRNNGASWEKSDWFDQLSQVAEREGKSTDASTEKS
jgi:hypothetical protein